MNRVICRHNVRFTVASKVRDHDTRRSLAGGKFDRSGKRTVSVIAPHHDLSHLIEIAADRCKRVEIAIEIEIRKRNFSDC